MLASLYLVGDTVLAAEAIATDAHRLATAADTTTIDTTGAAEEAGTVVDTEEVTAVAAEVTVEAADTIETGIKKKSSLNFLKTCIFS